MSLPIQIDKMTCGTKLVTQKETADALGVHISDVNVAVARIQPAIHSHPAKYRGEEMRAAMLEYYARRLARAEAVAEKWRERVKAVETWEM